MGSWHNNITALNINVSVALATTANGSLQSARQWGVRGTVRGVRGMRGTQKIKKNLKNIFKNIQKHIKHQKWFFFTRKKN